MASRALENKRDRFKVMLITPFMSCSARLPIYILFSEMFFQEHAMLAAYSMYVIGLVTAILVAAVIHLIDRRKSENYLLIELPEYKAPSARTVAIYVWEKVKDYLTKCRNHNLCGIDCDVGDLKFRSAWLYDRNGRQLRSNSGALSCAILCTDWPGILADSGCPDCWHFR